MTAQTAAARKKAEDDFAAYKLEVENARREIKAAERRLDRALNSGIGLYTQMMAARAADDSDAYPVGTRVHHRAFAEMLATVTESDGTGVAVVMDTDPETVLTGYAAAKWVAV